MASLSTNSAAVCGSLAAIADALRLDDARKLGDQIIGVAATAIGKRTRDQQVDPDGEPLATLTNRYRERKVRQGLDPRILVATDAMLAPDQIRGEIKVERRGATMTAGTTDEVKAKVDYAHSGSDDRPKRPFYDLGDDGIAAVDGVIGDAIDDVLRG